MNVTSTVFIRHKLKTKQDFNDISKWGPRKFYCNLEVNDQVLSRLAHPGLESYVRKPKHAIIFLLSFFFCVKKRDILKRRGQLKAQAVPN